MFANYIYDIYFNGVYSAVLLRDDEQIEIIANRIKAKIKPGYWLGQQKPLHYIICFLLFDIIALGLLNYPIQCMSPRRIAVDIFHWYLYNNIRISQKHCLKDSDSAKKL